MLGRLSGTATVRIVGLLALALELGIDRDPRRSSEGSQRRDDNEDREVEAGRHPIGIDPSVGGPLDFAVPSRR